MLCESGQEKILSEHIARSGSYFTSLLCVGCICILINACSAKSVH